MRSTAVSANAPSAFATAAAIPFTPGDPAVARARLRLFGHGVTLLDAVAFIIALASLGIAIALYILGHSEVIASGCIGFAIAVLPLIVFGVHERELNDQSATSRQNQLTGQNRELKAELDQAAADTKQSGRVIAIAVGAAQKRIEELQSRAILLSGEDTTNAYYFGNLGTTLPTRTDRDDGLVAVVRRLAGQLGVQFSDAERRTLDSEHPTDDEAEAITTLIVDKAYSLKQSLFYFFQLGNTIAWLRNQLDTMRSTQEVVRQLTDLASNPLLEIDPRYSDLINALLAALSPYQGSVSESEQAQIRAKVSEALQLAPPLYISSTETRTPVRGTDWLAMRDPDTDTVIATCIIGDHAILARNSTTFDIVSFAAPTEPLVHVTTDAAGWHCSAHPDASTVEPCTDIDIVSYANREGHAVSKARVIPVRYVNVDQTPLAVAPVPATKH